MLCKPLAFHARRRQAKSRVARSRAQRALGEGRGLSAALPAVASSQVGAPHSRAADNHLLPVQLSVGHSHLVVGSLGGSAWAEAHANTQAVVRALGDHMALRSGAGLPSFVPQALALASIEASEGGCLPSAAQQSGASPRNL